MIDINGCQREQTTEVRVRLVPKIHVPNIIQVGNPDNGEFFVTAEYVKLIKEFQVFDRWGNMVHNAKDILPNQRGNGWSGSTMGGQQASSGVYAYRIMAELSNPYIDKDGNTVTETMVFGDVTLLR